MRITDSHSDSAARINLQRSRLSVLQERLSTGKRINRPSDDPQGAEAVIRLKTSHAEIEQFERNASAANQKLTAADDALTGYEPLVERLRTLVAKGLTDTTTQDAKNALATEVDALSRQILNVANQKYGDEYLFGGTRQANAPFDPATAAANPIPTGAQAIQIEPGANAVQIGVTADTVFSDANGTIFADLTNAAAALRGTGNAANDRAALENTMSRLAVYSNLASVAHAKIGATMKTAEAAAANLAANKLSFEQRISDTEDADFVETATALAENERALEATLQTTAKGRRSLFDFLN